MRYNLLFGTVVTVTLVHLVSGGILEMLGTQCWQESGVGHRTRGFNEKTKEGAIFSLELLLL